MRVLPIVLYRTNSTSSDKGQRSVDDPAETMLMTFLIWQSEREAARAAGSGAEEISLDEIEAMKQEALVLDSTAPHSQASIYTGPTSDIYLNFFLNPFISPLISSCYQSIRFSDVHLMGLLLYLLFLIVFPAVVNI